MADTPTRIEFRARLLSEVGCLAAVLVATWPLLLGRARVVGDTLPQAYPFMACLQAALGRGEILLWNADLFSGYFMLGAVQSLSYYPVAWLLYGSSSLLLAYKLSEVFHLWLLARGVFGFVRELEASRRAALVAAAAATLCGSVAMHHQHLHIVNGLGWTGPILWAAARLVLGRGRWRAGLLLAASFALALLSSHPQYVFYAGLASLTLVSCVPLAERGRAIARIGACALASAPLAAALLIPLREYASLFPRPRVGGALEFLTSGGLRPIDVPGWLLGSTLASQPERVCFGAAFLVLALAGLSRVRASRVARIGAWVVAIGVVLSPAYTYQPLHRILIHVPPFSFLRRPARLGWFLQLGGALLAASAVQSLAAGTLRHAWTRWFPASAVGVALLASLAIAPTTGHEVRVVSVAAAVLGTLAAGVALRRGSKRWVIAALALGVFELSAVWLSAAATEPDAVVTTAPPLAAPVAASENPRLLDVGLPEEQTLASARRLKRNGGVRWGVRYVSGFEPLPPLPQEVLYRKFSQALEADPQAFAELCDRHSVRWIVTATPLKEGAALLARGESDGATLYENLDARPQAYTIGAAVTPVRVLEQRPTDWTLEVPDSPRARQLVVTQVWYPGWEATLDGRPVPVSLAEGLYLRVDVPPGGHRVRLVFDNVAVLVGQRVSLAAWLLWFLALAFGRRDPSPGSAVEAQEQAAQE